MALNPKLLEILACPRCKGGLEYRETEAELVCHHCKLTYRVVDDIPVMLIDEAEGDRDEMNRMLRERGYSLIPRSSAPSSADSPVDAVFFPWSVIVDPAAGKRALLYFDRVGILGPGPELLDPLIESIRSGDTRSDRFSREGRQAFTSFFESLRTLLDAGAVELIDAQSVLADAEARRRVKTIVGAEAFDPFLAASVSEMEAMTSVFGVPPAGYSPDLIRDGRLLEHGLRQTGELAVQYWTEGVALEVVAEVFDEANSRFRELPPEFQRFVNARSDLDKSILISLFCNTAIATIDALRSTPLFIGRPRAFRGLGVRPSASARRSVPRVSGC